MKSFGKAILKYLGVYCILIVVFIATLFLTSMIPSQAMKEKVVQSADTLLAESNRKYVHVKNFYLMIDNFTDSLMINTAYSIDSKDAFYSVMMARKNYIPGVTQTVFKDPVAELKSASKYKGLDQVGELYDTAHGDITESFEYARYWHGYLVFLRPLLVFFNVTNIRILLTIVAFGLCGIMIYLLCKKTNFIIALLFLTALILVDYQIIGQSLQCAPIMLLMMLASIVMLAAYDKIKKHLGIFFFIIGSLTCFFDFLTAPIITLGIPLIIYFLLRQKEEPQETIKQMIGTCVKISLLWAIGYGATWVTKWVLVDVLYHKGLIQTALSQLFYRTSGEQQYGFIKTIMRNWNVIQYYAIPYCSICILSVITVLARYKMKTVLCLKQAIPFAIILCMPLVWYFVLRNHSYLHTYFTYRSLLVLILALPIMVIQIIKPMKKGEDSEKTINKESKV